MEADILLGLENLLVPDLAGDIGATLDGIKDQLAAHKLVVQGTVATVLASIDGYGDFKNKATPYLEDLWKAKDKWPIIKDGLKSAYRPVVGGLVTGLVLHFINGAPVNLEENVMAIPVVLGAYSLVRGPTTRYFNRSAKE